MSKEDLQFLAGVETLNADMKPQASRLQLAENGDRKQDLFWERTEYS